MALSGQLLLRYRDERDEAAFAEVVRLELDLVYSTALRQLQDPDLAQDVTQVVFADLAAKAGSLCGRAEVSGWLYRHTCFVAAKTRRKEWRRRLREQRAMEALELTVTEPQETQEIAPILDEALRSLKSGDRDVLILRFFRQCSFAELGQALGIQENAARMRVERALQRLRTVLAKRRPAFSAATLAAVLASVTAPAPSGLAAIISASALAAQAGPWMIGLNILSTMNMTKMGVAITAVAVATSIVTPLFLQHKLHSLQKQNDSLRRQTVERAQPRDANRPPIPEIIDADELKRLRAERAELVRLRGEVGLLRRQLTDRSTADRAATTAAPSSKADPEDDADGAAPIPPGVYEADAWANEGFGSPQNSSLTFLWSLRNGYAKEYSDALGKTNVQRFPLEWANDMNKIKRTQLSETSLSDDGRPQVSLVHELKDGTTANTWLGFTNVENRWLVKRISGYPIVVWQTAIGTSSDR